MTLVLKRLTSAEQFAGRCVHFTGMMKPSCGAGIAYADVRLTHGPVEYRREHQSQTYLARTSLPCLQSHNYCGAVCSRVEFPTPDVVTKHEEERKASIQRVTAARAAIVATIKETGRQRGAIPCPTCGASLGYSQASNGHIWARCETPDCAAWME